MRTSVSLRARVRSSLFALIRVREPAYMCACFLEFVRACVRESVRACVHVCVSVSVCA